MDRQFYKTNGYLILRNFLAKNEIDQVLSDVHSVVREQLKYLEAPYASTTDIDSIFADMKMLYHKDIARYLSAIRLCAKLTSIFQAIASPKIIAAAQELGLGLPIFQTQPVFHVLAEDLKIKDGYFGIGAHQDWPSLQSGLDTFVTWVPLVPVGPNNFTLEIFPKSHLLGFCQSTAQEHVHEISPKIYEELDFLKIEMAPGDIILFSAFLIHRSELTASPNKLRFSYSMRYENALDPYFIRLGYPSAQKRVVDRALDEKNIPTQAEVAKVF